jgi:hypothetical protein
VAGFGGARLVRRRNEIADDHAASGRELLLPYSSGGALALSSNAAANQAQKSRLGGATEISSVTMRSLRHRLRFRRKAELAIDAHLDHLRLNRAHWPPTITLLVGIFVLGRGPAF